MRKYCFLDLVCGECAISVRKKDVDDVQWQKEKNVSANSFIVFFLPFFFCSYVKNAKPQIYSGHILHSPTEMWITFTLFRPYIFFHHSLCNQRDEGFGVSPTSPSLYTTMSVYDRFRANVELNLKSKTTHCGKSTLDIDMNCFRSEEQKQEK